MTEVRPGAGFWFLQLTSLSDVPQASPSGAPVELVASNPELRDGDVVFVWVNAPEPGLAGWGLARSAGRGSYTGLASKAAPNALSRQFVNVALEVRLYAAIPSRLLATAPGLSDAPLIRQTQTGTNFRLSAEQAFELSEVLRSAGHPAPAIAISDVLDPIARRVERELVGLQKLLPEVLPADSARSLGELSAATASRLASGGLLGAYEPVKSLIDSLASIVSSAQGERASLLAPLSAARTRLMNDVFQIERLTDASERAKATLDALQGTDDEYAFPPEIPAAESGRPAAPAPAAPSSRPADTPAAAPEPAIAPAPAAAPARAPAPPPFVPPAPAPGRGSDGAAAQPAPAVPPTVQPPAAQPAQPGGPPQPMVPPVVMPAETQPGAAPTKQMPPPFAPASAAAPKDPLFRHWEQTDLIGIGAAVNNLARYISHEGLLPPVAIGVFGDWGSGKSFFIRALQSQIALLSSQSRDALTDNRTTVFCSHIVQIEFNAWHFVESNLWASLAAHIFERLYTELERRGENEGANRNIDGLYQQFSAYKQAVAEQERLTTLVDSLAEKRNQAQAKKLAAEKSVKTRLLALTDVVKKGVKDLAGQRLTATERSRLGELLEASNLEDLNAASDEAVEIAREGKGLFGRMKVQLSWWGGWHLSLFAILIGVVVFGLPLLLPWLLGTQADNLQKVVTLFGGYAATAVVLLGWLARGGRKLVTAARKVEGVLKEVRANVESAADPALDAAKRELTAAESELTLIEAQVTEQRDRLAELADELDPNQLGTRLQAFLEARVKNDAYQKHLGLISLVRKDFSSLYELMQRYWQQRKKPVPEVLADVRNALGEAAQAQVPFIERIVLYIDDLDRCPEDKVVEVLQAVHLMLGLPLFVVVVAVDVRWVGESIRKHYGKLVGWDEDNQRPTAEIASATADDYLEKIFQIPYRIHPMEPDVRKLLLGGLLRQPYLSAAGGANASQPPAIRLQELVPKELSLYPEEQRAIEELYGAVGSSPRRVRRFLDVYRLMRAGMEEGDVQDLIAKKHYVVILALFAMLSGAPRTAPRLIELLRRETLRLPDEPAATAFAQEVLANWCSGALADVESRPADEMEVIANAMRYVDALNLARPDLLSVLHRWIPEIARYSFREVRMQRL